MKASRQILLPDPSVSIRRWPNIQATVILLMQRALYASKSGLKRLKEVRLLYEVCFWVKTKI